MLSGADLSKILDEGYGDTGFNDDVEDAPAKAASRSTERPKEAAAPAKAPSERKDRVPKPYERPAVSGAPVPPPSGTDLKQYEVSMAMDQAAREKGYKNAEEFNKYLEQSGALKKEMPEEEMTQLAPGIKKAPAYMPPGAYPGDRTKIGKAYEKEHQGDAVPPQAPITLDPPKVVWVKQADQPNHRRAEDGQTITFRIDESEETRTAEVGGADLPWALDHSVRRMKVGDIADITGCGEYAFADSEALVAGTERRWRFELVDISGRRVDKFGMGHSDRLALAEALRLRGNDLYKKGRLHRAMHLYERGSSLLDVLEPEEMGGGLPGPRDPKVIERNARTWQCQKPLLLNHALILMKLERWQDAERKCTEVLMDIDKLNVKALFRRGQCNINLGKHEQARTDLSRAAELDTSISKEVEREMEKVMQMQRVEDEGDKGVAKKVVQGFLEERDARSEAPPPTAAPTGPDPTQRLMDMLEAQREAADRDSTDEDDYRRQREAIYRRFFAPGTIVSPGEAAEDDEA